MYKILIIIKIILLFVLYFPVHCTYKCVPYFPVLMKVSLFAEASDLGRLAEFVNRINIRISPLHLQIKKGINEVTAAQYYGLVGYCKV